MNKAGISLSFCYCQQIPWKDQNQPSNFFTLSVALSLTPTAPTEGLSLDIQSLIFLKKLSNSPDSY